ncbi:hypothetical protein F1559_001011 [Cyanidiococcus yangmingshanensis]|uniref:Uncharacterized protein n=1 Tax=Cyanidiococcus yangmingshanensis TaxID=2690220 RepID=A0A7J7ICG4_9RHOD|nr:hypothetical protein F1559_001011 [Cyanidiococcus yangmingshanensis]
MQSTPVSETSSFAGPLLLEQPPGMDTAGSHRMPPRTPWPGPLADAKVTSAKYIDVAIEASFRFRVACRLLHWADTWWLVLGSQPSCRQFCGVFAALELPLGGMSPVPLLIPAVLGKADATFKLLGGSSIVFNVIKSYIFGKPLRCIEYPDGDLATIKLFSMSISSLRQRIAQAQPPPFPTVVLRGDDVKQVSVFYAPIFTEPVRTNADVRALPDASWLFWSLVSPEEAIIPRRGVKLESAPPLLPRTSSTPSRWTSAASNNVAGGSSVATTEAQVQDLAVQLVRALYSVGGGCVLGREEYDRLIDLAVDGDRALLALARNFRDDQSAFSYHAKRLLQRRLGDDPWRPRRDSG